MLLSLTKALLLFLLAGPLLGLAAVILQEPTYAGVVLPAVLIVLAYALGAVPALVTGLAAWAVRGKVGRYSGAILCGAVGASAAITRFIFLPNTTMDWESMADWLSLAKAWMFPGAFAGLICGLIYFWSKKSSQAPRNVPTHRPQRSRGESP